MYLANAFSLQMLNDSSANVQITEVDSLPDNLVSAIGHKETADILHVPFSRISIKLNAGDTLYVAQLTGGRLPEGCTKLPEGVKFKYFKVSVSKEQRLPSVSDLLYFYEENHLVSPFYTEEEALSYIKRHALSLKELKAAVFSLDPSSYYVRIGDVIITITDVSIKYVLASLEGTCKANGITFPEKWRGYHA